MAETPATHYILIRGPDRRPLKKLPIDETSTSRTSWTVAFPVRYPDANVIPVGCEEWNRQVAHWEKNAPGAGHNREWVHPDEVFVWNCEYRERMRKKLDLDNKVRIAYRNAPNFTARDRDTIEWATYLDDWEEKEWAEFEVRKAQLDRSVEELIAEEEAAAKAERDGRGMYTYSLGEEEGECSEDGDMPRFEDVLREYDEVSDVDSWRGMHIYSFGEKEDEYMDVDEEEDEEEEDEFAEEQALGYGDV